MTLSGFSYHYPCCLLSSNLKEEKASFSQVTWNVLAWNKGEHEQQKEKAEGFFFTHGYWISFLLFAPTLLSQHPLQRKLINSWAPQNLAPLKCLWPEMRPGSRALPEALTIVPILCKVPKTVSYKSWIYLCFLPEIRPAEARTLLRAPEIPDMLDKLHYSHSDW